jgi:uncharacterized protein YggT (Ycf19 family)
MSLIDFILNLAGLLLWVSWRYVPFDLANKIRPATLTGTLRRAEPMRVRAWHFLAALVALVAVRALFYWWIGAAVNWTPGVNLGAIGLSFRSDFYWRMAAYSVASFAHTLGAFYLWLLLLSLLNPRAAEAESCHRFVRIQLGVVHGWPAALKAVLPFGVAALAWLALEPLLGLWQIVPPATSWLHRSEQAVLLGAGVYLLWRFLVGAVLALYLLNSYVYLGSHPLWNYIDGVAHRLLAPLRRLPLRAAKVDFTPVVGIALVFLAAELLEHGLHKTVPLLQLQINVPGLVDFYRKISG